MQVFYIGSKGVSVTHLVNAAVACVPQLLCLRVQWLAIEIERKRGAERERESELERDGEARTRSYLNTQYKYINHF